MCYRYKLLCPFNGSYRGGLFVSRGILQQYAVYVRERRPYNSNIYTDAYTHINTNENPNRDGNAYHDTNADSDTNQNADSDAYSNGHCCIRRRPPVH